MKPALIECKCGSVNIVTRRHETSAFCCCQTWQLNKLMKKKDVKKEGRPSFEHIACCCLYCGNEFIAMDIEEHDAKDL